MFDAQRLARRQKTLWTVCYRRFHAFVGGRTRRDRGKVLAASECYSSSCRVRYSMREQTYCNYVRGNLALTQTFEIGQKSRGKRIVGTCVYERENFIDCLYATFPADRPDNHLIRWHSGCNLAAIDYSRLLRSFIKYEPVSDPCNVICICVCSSLHEVEERRVQSCSERYIDPFPAHVFHCSTELTQCHMCLLGCRAGRELLSASSLVPIGAP